MQETLVRRETERRGEERRGDEPRRQRRGEERRGVARRGKEGPRRGGKRKGTARREEWEGKEMRLEEKTRWEEVRRKQGQLFFPSPFKIRSLCAGYVLKDRHPRPTLPLKLPGPYPTEMVPSRAAALATCLALCWSSLTGAQYSSRLEDNGGHFRSANIYWEVVSNNTVKFTIESAWRRDYGSAYWKGSGADGLSVTGDLIFLNGRQWPIVSYGDTSMTSGDFVQLEVKEQRGWR
eukprot:747542-Hanusia_phi.AAC.1